jgi:hypothetical protein
VVYDPNSIESITVEYDNDSRSVEELQIGEYTGPRPKLPKSMLPALPGTSRLLDVKAKQNEQRQDVVRRAIRFDGLRGGEANV